MSGKYMKVKRVIIPTITMILLSSMLFGCAATSQEDSFNMLQQTDQIELEYAVPEYDVSEESTVALLPWLQLSSLETHPELRKAFDESLGVTGTTGNKEGDIYFNIDDGRASQNVTLYMILRNVSVRGNFVLESKMTEFGNMAAEYYTDVEADDLTAPYAAINAYFELLPDQEAGQFDGDATISRAQAMALVMRATTLVSESGAPETDAEFTTAVGESQYTDFAAPMNDYAYINTNSGLNEGVFNSAMSRGEYICMITNLLISDYEAALEASGSADAYMKSDVKVTSVADAGNISYAEAISDASKGVPSDMFATFQKAVEYNLVPETMLEDWDTSVTKAEALEMFIGMVNNYVNNCNGENLGSSEDTNYEETAGYIEGAETGEFGETLPGEGSGDQKFQDWVRAQGADYACGWTFIYENGKGAGSQPTYGVYMKEGSPLYGTVYHVGDIMPTGDRLRGTPEEWDVWTTEDMIEKVEEEGLEVYENEDGDTVIVIK